MLVGIKYIHGDMLVDDVKVNKYFEDLLNVQGEREANVVGVGNEIKKNSVR